MFFENKDVNLKFWGLAVKLFSENFAKQQPVAEEGVSPWFLLSHGSQICVEKDIVAHQRVKCRFDVMGDIFAIHHCPDGSSPVIYSFFFNGSKEKTLTFTVWGSTRESVQYPTILYSRWSIWMEASINEWFLISTRRSFVEDPPQNIKWNLVCCSNSLKSSQFSGNFLAWKVPVGGKSVERPRILPWSIVEQQLDLGLGSDQTNRKLLSGLLVFLVQVFSKGILQSGDFSIQPAKRAHYTSYYLWMVIKKALCISDLH